MGKTFWKADWSAGGVVSQVIPPAVHGQFLQDSQSEVGAPGEYMAGDVRQETRRGGRA